MSRIPIGRKRKIAFVCSGGATKAGAFHLGVALALQEQGFTFMGGLAPKEANPLELPEGVSFESKPMEISTFVGSSAGSIICSYLAAGYTIDNVFNAFLNRQSTDPVDNFPKPLPPLTYSKMFRIRPELAREQLSQWDRVFKIVQDLSQGSWQSLLQLKWVKATGLFTTAGLEQYLREEVLESNRFLDYRADLFIVATQLNHSRKVVFGKYAYEPPPHDLTCQYDNKASISEACAASTALPFVYAPYEIRHSNGELYHYIDGEIRDTLSTHVAVDAGCDLVIASHTHQPYHFEKKIGSLMDHGLPAILVQSLYLVIEQKINNYIHAKETQRSMILALERHCKEIGLTAEQVRGILGVVEAELHHRRDVDTIYIHPDPTDAGMFFGEHFSLSPARMMHIVKSGFRATVEKLRQYDFADRPPRG